MSTLSRPLLNVRSARLYFSLFVALVSASICSLSANAQNSTCGALSGGVATCSTTDKIQTADNTNAYSAHASPEIPSSNYPDLINFAYTGTVTGVQLTLNNIDAPCCGTDGDEGLYWTQVVLVSPTGASSKALVFLGGLGQANDSISGLTINFKDTYPSAPYTTDIPLSGTQNYSPTDILDNEGAGGGLTPVLPGSSVSLTPSDWPQPDGSATLNGIFNGVSAAGNWRLYLADWNGDAVTINGWSLTLTIDQTQSSTTTVVTGNTDPAVAGNSVTYTATVSSSGVPVTAGGTVAFYGNGGSTPISSCAAQPINGSGQATCAVTLTAGTAAQCESTTVPTFPAVCQGGNTDIVAKYSGVNNTNGDFGASISSSYVQWVGGTITNPQTDQYCNTNPIYAVASTAATTYPSYIPVSGLSASTVSGVSVQLQGISSTDGVSGQFLLVSPGGTHNLDFLDEGFAIGSPTSETNLNFEDTAGQKPDGGPVPTGSSSNWEAYVDPSTVGHTFPPASGLPTAIPAVPGTITYPPANSSNEFATAFNGATANGDWALYVTNGDGAGTTTLANGWCITLTPNTGVASTTTITSSQNPAPVNTPVTYTATVTSGGSPVTSGGTVTFLDNGNNPAGTAEQITLGASGTASFSSSSLYDQVALATTTVDVFEGDHTITADYSGSGSDDPSIGSMVERINNPTTITAGSGNSINACNAGPIYSGQGNQGAFTPNPSIITTANIPGTVQAVTLTLENLSTENIGYVNQIESLVEGPTGAALDFFSGTGGSSGGLTLGNYEFEDGQTSVPTSTFSPGTYAATSELGGDTYASGYYTAPSSFTYAQPHGTGTFFNVFGGTNPNGNWALFFNMKTGEDPASIAKGWCLNFTENAVGVSVDESYTGAGASGDFEQGEIGAQITTTITNNGTGPTGDPTGTNPLVLTDTLNSALTYTGYTGAGWTCSASGQTVTCTNDTAIAQGSSYPELALNVNVSLSAAGTFTNTANVSGAGITANSGSDTIRVDAAPVLSLTKSHSSTFTQGSTAQWTLVVSNVSASGATSGTVTVSDTLPAGYSLNSSTSTSGLWTCLGSNAVTCTATPGITAGNSSIITLTVNVPATSPTSVSNTASAWGGGDLVHTSASTAAFSNTDTATVVQAPASIVIIGGNNQSTLVATPFLNPLTVKVSDAGGVAISGLNVTFTASPGASVTLSPVGSCITATNGECSVTAMAGTAAMPYTVTAQVGSVSANFALTNLPGPATVVGVISGSPQSTIVGLNFANPLTVLVTDQYGNAVSGDVVTFTAPSSGASATLSSSGSCTTNSVGECSVTATANSTTGSYNVVASITGGTTTASFSLTNNPVPNYVVNTTTDDATGTASNCTSSPEGTCTLRDALAAATNAGTANITFASSAFPAPNGATITLGTAGTLTIPSKTTIQGLTTGSGASLTNLVTVDGASGAKGQFSIFTVNSGTTGAAIANLTITHGAGTTFGGGITNNGSLTVTGSAFVNNEAQGGGAIANLGTLTVTGSAFVGNVVNSTGSGGSGGAIGNVGTLAVSNSTFANNTAGPSCQGGAIWNNGTAVVNSSTFSGNSAPTASGGGIYNNNSLTNSLTVANNIFSNDAGGECAGSCSGSSSDVGNLVDSNGTVARLSTLGNHGGPTQTMIPLPGSAAICAGSASAAAAAGVTADQRGVALNAGGYCPSGSVDVGAVQTDYAVSFTTNPAATEASGIAFNASVTLTESGLGVSGVTIPVTASAGTLAGSPVSATTGTNGVASYSLTMTSASLLSNVTLTATLPAPPTLTATSTPFSLGQAATTITASNFTATYSSSSQAATLSATVTSTSGVVNGGTVTFGVFNGATQVGVPTTSSTVSNGVASVNYVLPAGLPAGTYTIVATYNGGANFGSSSDNTHTLTINSTATTATASNVSASFSTSAQSVTLSATVTSAAGVVNGGVVTFSVFNGATQIGSSTSPATVTNGAASAVYTLPAGEPVGNYQIVAAYTNANGNFASSSDSTHQLIVTAATTASASNASVTYSSGSQFVTLSAAVTSAAGIVNGGTVTFGVLNGATQVGVPITSATVANGAASVNYVLPAGLPAGTYSIVATYNGGANFGSSSDNTHTLTISPASTITAASNVATIYNPSGQNATFNATVTSASGVVNSGTVTFTVLQGATPIGTATTGAVSAGAASVSYAPPGTATAGTYTIQAVYSGTAGSFAGSSDTTHSLTINPIPNFTVNTVSDDPSGVASNCTSSPTGTCSLRDALAAAASGGANITFAPTVFTATNTAAQNTITLNGGGGTLTIPTNTTIQGLTTGSGASLTNLVTVNGASGSFSVFTVNSGTAEIANLIITGGNPATGGGGIVNKGILTVNSSTITHNTTSNGGGGGILNYQTLAVNNSAITNNTVGAGLSGAGIFNLGTIALTNTTVSGNSAPSNAGAIFNNGGTLTLVQSTISGNSASFTGGIYSSPGTITMSNSIVAGNSAGSYADIDGNYTDNGGSLAQNGSGGTSTINPGLAPLGNYGGPTQTMLPAIGSKAICAGLFSLPTGAGVAADQRGVAFGNTGAGNYCASGSVDAGAVQTDYALAFTTEPGTTQISGVAFPAAVTLTEDGSAFTAASESIAVTLSGSATLSGSPVSESTSAGVASYSLTATTASSVSGQQLDAGLTLNSNVAPAVAVTAASNSFNLDTLTAPTISASFSPTTIAAGGNSMLTFTVTNPNPIPISNVNFSDTVPAGITLVTEESATCDTLATGGGATNFNSSAITVTSNQLAGGASCTVTVEIASNAPGNYFDTTSTVSSTQTSAGVSASAALTVNPASLTASVTAASKTYNGTAAATITGCVLNGVLASDAGNVTCSAAGATFATNSAGNAVVVTATGITLGGSAAGKYTLSSTTATTNANITPAPLAITAGNASFVYGSTVAAIKPNYTGFVGTDSSASLTAAPTCTTTATSTSPVGTYPSTCSGAVDPNYTISYVAGTVTVTPAALTVTASNTSTAYGTVPAVSPNYSGFVAGNTQTNLTAAASCSSTVTASTPAGTYAGANTCAGAVDPNYVISYVPGTATVTQAAQTVSFTQPSSPVVYGIAPISLSATASSGLTVTFSVVSGPGSISGSALTVTGAGTIVVAASQPGNSNYTAAAQVTRSITVNDATLTITASNASKVYGTANPTFTGTVTGQQNGDIFTETFATTATTNSPVGTYSVVPSVAGANLADYTQSVTDGALIITQAASATTLAVGSTSITPGQSVTLTATVTDASAGSTGTPTGTVSFYDGGTLLNATPAAVTGGIATYSTAALAPGVTHTITATYSGDVNFTGSSSTPGAATNITVAPLDFTMTLTGPANLSVVPGQSISYQVTVTPDYGSYAGTVNFAVSGLPPGATVTFSPASIAANSGSQTVTVTIQTAPATAMNREWPQTSGRKLAPIALGFLFLIGAGALRRRGKMLRGLLCVLVLIGAGAASTMMSGCGSNGGFFAQPPQNYSVTVTATTANLQHSATITLNVQ